MEQKRASKKNPLYVVTKSKKGSVVEEASGLLDLLIKKFNLAPVVQILQALMESLLAQVNSYAMFMSIKKVIDDLLDQVMALVAPFISPAGRGQKV